MDLKSRTESPAIPAGCAAGSRLDIETVMRFGFKMMRKILLNHLFRQLVGCDTGIAPRPKMLPPNTASAHTEILRILSAMFAPSHIS